MLHRVDQQIAQDALDAPPVDLSHAGLGREPELNLGAAALGQLLCHVGRVPDEIAHIDGLRIEGRRIGVVPADLQQVGEQRLEPLQLALQ